MGEDTPDGGWLFFCRKNAGSEGGQAAEALAYDDHFAVSDDLRYLRGEGVGAVFGDVFFASVFGGGQKESIDFG
ncbi:hypothetical protein CLAC_01735 [Corynebacterium lactis RW2-5]|uniref:Uncharacterized protein n=1 Tax=Corynebacterium lactis RW2-5 TaxID=1408189 RepID=A0A0K2H2V4_9CORY|nr:hypothetical protein CLAC_01735 [Corynebacterium lactis RW2-5]